MCAVVGPKRVSLGALARRLRATLILTVVDRGYILAETVQRTEHREIRTDRERSIGRRKNIDFVVVASAAGIARMRNKHVRIPDLTDGGCVRPVAHGKSVVGR